MTQSPDAPHVVRIHMSPEIEHSVTDVEMTKPAPILVQPSTNHAHTLAEATSLSARLPPVQVAFRGVRFGVDIEQGKTKEHRVILKGCDGVFQPGRLTAVMGASGAGKTSLLNIVSGNPTAGKKEGELMINGENVFDSMARIRELSAFIQQDDILMATQTVREAVTFSAMLRLPKSMPIEAKLARVDEVLDMLGLQKCADTIIGNAFNKGISGGEKRRVSMALELVKSPAILFLDEPTSGLDTFTAHSIVALLRDIAHDQGKTIACTIHQPSSEIFWMFDDLILLADGQVMYHGPIDGVVDYFAQRGLPCPDHFNPADHLFMRVLYNTDAQLKMITDDMALAVATAKQQRHDLQDATSAEELAAKKREELAAASERTAANTASYAASQAEEKVRVAGLLKEWLASKENENLQAALATPLRSPLPDPSLVRAELPGEWFAFRLLSSRRWYDLLRDRMKVRMQFGQYLFFSLLISLIYVRITHSQKSVQNREGALFFISVQALFMSFLSNLNTFGPEKIVMMREMESGMYRLPAYFFSRWIIELPFRILFPFMYSVILYWIIGYQINGEKFILFAVALILLDNCGTAMAICLCSAFPEPEQVMQVGPVLLMPLMVFSGFYAKISSIGWWFRWIAYISPVRYGFGAIIKNEMNGLTFDCGSTAASSCITTGEQVIKQLGLDTDPSIGLNLAILVILLGGLVSIAFSLLWSATRRK